MIFAHFSDPHQDVNGMHEAHRVLTQLNLNDPEHLLCTGDVCANYFEHDFTYSDPKTFCFAMGNHDCISAQGVADGYLADEKPNMEQLYNKFFKPYLNFTHINIKENTTWWYKDIRQDITVRVLGLDNHVRDRDYYAEWRWLEDLLNNTKIPIIILSHILTSNLTLYRLGNFTSEYFKNDRFWPHENYIIENLWFPFMKKADELINAWADKSENNKVIVWLNGHEHADGLFISANKNKYPRVCCGSIIHDIYNDNTRWENNDATINIYNYNNTYLEVSRPLGSNTTHGGALRKIAYWDYDTKQWYNSLSR